MTRRPPALQITGDCRRQLATLFAYLDGELTPVRRRRLERHLANCHCCDDLRAGVTQAIEACRSTGQARVPAQVHRRAVLRVRKLLDRPEARS